MYFLHFLIFILIPSCMAKPRQFFNKRTNMAPSDIIKSSNTITGYESRLKIEGRMAAELNSCTDQSFYSTDCPYWASIGLCSTSQWGSFMNENCKKSCGLCEAGKNGIRSV